MKILKIKQKNFFYLYKYYILKISLFAQCMYPPRNEWIKNNTYFLIKELCKYTDIELISHAPKEKSTLNIEKNVSVNYFFKLSNSKIIQIFHTLVWTFKTLKFFLSKKIDIILVQYLETSFLPALFLLSVFKKNIKLYITIYSTDELNIWYKRLFLKMINKKVKKFILISPFLIDYIKDIVDTWKWEIIPIWYDKNRYLKYSDFSKRDKKTILFCAWIIKESWSFMMVDLAKIMPEFNFIFALRKFNKKSEKEYKELTNYINKNQIKNIEIKRNISNMENLLSGVWCLVLPLQDINIKMVIPVSLLEAMARGTICFVSDLENLKCLVKNEENAIVFDKTNVQELKYKINQFINDERIAQNAYEFWKNYPDYVTIGKLYFKLLNNPKC